MLHYRIYWLKHMHTRSHSYSLKRTTEQLKAIGYMPKVYSNADAWRYVDIFGDTSNEVIKTRKLIESTLNRSTKFGKIVAFFRQADASFP